MIAVGMTVETGASDGLQGRSGLSRRSLCRLKKPRDFDEAFSTGRGHAGRYVVLRYRCGEEAGRRVGVVASKRTFRRAVDRNRAKRLLREAFRMSRECVVPDVDLVLVARRRILEARCQDVCRELVSLVRRAGVAAIDMRRSERIGDNQRVGREQNP